jgi:hypothetical protein
MQRAKVTEADACQKFLIPVMGLICWVEHVERRG